MKVVFTEGHRRHDPKHELELGRFVPFKECPARMDSILKAVVGTLTDAVIPPKDHGMEPILRVHTKAYVEWISKGGNPDGVFPDVYAVRDFSNERRIRTEKANKTVESIEGVEFRADGGALGRPGFFCYDTCGIIAEGTFAAAYDAVQVAITAANALLDSGDRAVFALTRPPGHHAHEDLCGGYCFFNNAAIAVRHLIDTYKLERVAILDIDYHHDYPFYWGSSSEIGEGAGKGFNVNIPLPIGTKDAEYVHALKTVVEGRIKDYKPQVVVVSLGVDTFIKDVVGNFCITSECYLDIGKIIGGLSIPTLFIMEGGYDVPAIGTNVSNVLKGFENGWK
ncbi:hypothetical protein HDU67_006090 [Dinochytrium kinnereticum]|nr:hypothetical protein HDU67_006090 [Dinochytrium kinnereticum]